MRESQSRRLVAVWLLSFIVCGLLLEADLWHHHALLISWYVATWFVAYPAFVFSVGVLLGHWAGQGFRVPRLIDLLVWCIIVLTVACVATPTLTLAVAGVAVGHCGWQFVQNRIPATTSVDAGT